MTPENNDSLPHPHTYEAGPLPSAHSRRRRPALGEFCALGPSAAQPSARVARHPAQGPQPYPHTKARPTAAHPLRPFRRLRCRNSSRACRRAARKLGGASGGSTSRKVSTSRARSGYGRHITAISLIRYARVL